MNEWKLILAQFSRWRLKTQVEEWIRGAESPGSDLSRREYGFGSFSDKIFLLKPFLQLIKSFQEIVGHS